MFKRNEGSGSCNFSFSLPYFRRREGRTENHQVSVIDEAFLGDPYSCLQGTKRPSACVILNAPCQWNMPWDWKQHLQNTRITSTLHTAHTHIVSHRAECLCEVLYLWPQESRKPRQSMMKYVSSFPLSCDFVKLVMWGWGTHRKTVGLQIEHDTRWVSLIPVLLEDIIFLKHSSVILAKLNAKYLCHIVLWVK